MRASLEGIPEYKAGQRPAPREDITTFKVSSNENPYPPLPRVLDVIANAASEINRYPDPGASDLIAAIGRYHAVPESHIAVGTGAVALCYQVANCTAEAGDEIIYPWRSFEAYPIVSRVAGATPVPVPLTDAFEHDLPAMASAINERTRLIFLCSPNNPTGTALSGSAVNEFLDQVPKDVLVVLDEAYIEFCDDSEISNGIPSYQERNNVAVLRTFSKAYGLAGLRVGYAIAPEHIVTALKKTALPFGVSGVAQAAAVASLDDDAELMQRVDALIAERSRVQTLLRATNVPISDSQANFVWIATGDRTDEFSLACDAAGLTVRPFPGEGARVTIAEPEANDRLVQIAANFAHPEPPEAHR